VAVELKNIQKENMGKIELISDLKNIFTDKKLAEISSFFPIISTLSPTMINHNVGLSGIRIRIDGKRIIRYLDIYLYEASDSEYGTYVAVGCIDRKEFYFSSNELLEWILGNEEINYQQEKR
jgi:hypothetical protein